MSGTNQEIEGSGAASGPAGGELSGFYPNPTLVNSAVIGKVLTGYVSGAGTILATDTLLQAIQKLNGNIAALPVITASNGLTMTLGNVQLGGALIQNTAIDGLFDLKIGQVTPVSSFNVCSGDLTTTHIDLLMNGIIGIFQSIDTTTGESNSVYIEPTFGVELLSTNSTGILLSKIEIRSTQQTISDTSTDNTIIISDGISSKGVVYAADYSANFTPESLITKRYADALIGDYVIKAAAYILLPEDGTSEVTVAGATQTLPTAVGKLNKRYRVINASLGVVRVDTTSSQTIGNKVTGNPTFMDLNPEDWLDVISNGTNWRMI